MSDKEKGKEIMNIFCVNVPDDVVQALSVNSLFLD